MTSRIRMRMWLVERRKLILLCLGGLLLWYLLHKQDRKATQSRHHDEVFQYKRRFYENYQASRHGRVGLGEGGVAAYLLRGAGKEEGLKSVQTVGVNIPLSNAIALDRTLPDYRYHE